jgi:hypothetical protein
MIANVHSYRLLEKCFEVKMIVFPYKKYLCDCKERKLISDLQTIQNRYRYNTLKVTPLQILDIGNFIEENYYGSFFFFSCAFF